MRAKNSLPVSSNFLSSRKNLVAVILKQTPPKIRHSPTSISQINEPVKQSHTALDIFSPKMQCLSNSLKGIAFYA
jgi:hypothetical protein